MKCPLCDGSGVHTQWIGIEKSPVMVKGPCGACAGTCDLPREILESQLKTWAYHSLKVLIQMIGLDKPELSLEEQNKYLFLEMEMEKISRKALDFAMAQQTPLLNERKHE